MTGRYVDGVKNKSGLLGGRVGIDLIIDGRKVCRQSEDQEWAAGMESWERSCH